MANNLCNGDFYLVEGKQFYRCLWDGCILSTAERIEQCPRCLRPIDAQTFGEFETRIVVTVEVKHPVRGWISHASHVSVPDESPAFSKSSPVHHHSLDSDYIPAFLRKQAD